MGLGSSAILVFLLVAVLVAGLFCLRVFLIVRAELGRSKANIARLSDEIEKLNNLKREFISTVSHELRTPLTAIGGYAKLLSAGDAGAVNGTQKEFLNIINTNVDRLGNLITDFIDAERIEAGTAQFDFKPCDLVSILRECVETFQVSAQKKGLDLSMTGPLEPLFVKGDRGRLVQIFMNLLSNSIKYTKQGNVLVELVQLDYAVLVHIRDSGVGLSHEEQEKLFHRFYRTRSGINSPEEGSGLGLSIVKKLLEAHGGAIKIESALGLGSTFTIMLPVLPGYIVEAVSGRDVAAGDVDRTSRRNIWLIGLSREESHTIHEWLSENDTQLLDIKYFDTFSSLPQLSSVSSAPALVVLDPVSIKDSSSGQLGSFWIADLRQKLRQSVPVLVVSSELDSSSAFAEGASAWLPKPLDKQRFVAVVLDLAKRPGWRVLVVDSNADLRILVKRALEQRGFSVDDLDRGNAVISRLEQERYDLVLMDIGLSDVSGMELLKIIRGSSRYAGLPIFMMSIDEKHMPDLDQIAALGESKYIPKYRGLNFIIDDICQYLEDRKLVEHLH